jgi:hypothetical protein
MFNYNNFDFSRSSVFNVGDSLSIPPSPSEGRDTNEAMENGENANTNAIILDDGTKHSVAVQCSWRPPQTVSNVQSAMD